MTARGENQARESVEALRKLGPFAQIVTSTLTRAAHTGDLIAEVLGVDAVRREQRIVERHAGPWQGLTRFEIDEQWPGYLDGDQRPDGYELDPSVVERSSAALLSIAGEHLGETLLVVSHGGVINALEKHQGEPWKRLDNLEGRWFQSDGKDLVPVGDRVRLGSWDQPSAGRAHN